MKYIDYYNSLDKQGKIEFAEKIGTSYAYLSQLATGHRKAGIKTCLEIQRVTAGVVTIADVRPDLI